MKKEDAKKLIPIIEAYGNGRDVEWFDGHVWQTGTYISFSDKPENYRIKPEPKLVPFTFEDNLLFRDKWIRLKGKKPLCKFDNITEFGVRNNLGVASYSELFKNYEFEDGSVCGKLVNE